MSEDDDYLIRGVDMSEDDDYLIRGVDMSEDDDYLLRCGLEMPESGIRGHRSYLISIEDFDRIHNIEMLAIPTRVNRDNFGDRQIEWVTPIRPAEFINFTFNVETRYSPDILLPPLTVGGICTIRK